MELEKEINRIIRETIRISPKDFLEADSLKIAELVCELEDFFNIKISDSEFYACRAVSDIYDIVKQKLAEKNETH